MSVLCVSLFGDFHVHCGEQDLTSLYPRRLQELLCYLLLYRDRAHPRETLASLLWSDSSTVQSKKNLRQALWQVQTASNSGAGSPGASLLLADPDRVRFNPDADTWLDVALFERASGHAQGVPGQDLDAPRVQALREAVDLYRGDLLEGWFQDWCLYERERLQNMYLAILGKLMDHCEASEEYEAGLAYGTCILRIDGARERTHRRLMRLHYLAGDRTAALRQYERCVEALRRELAVKPATRTVELCEQIRAERFTSVAQWPFLEFEAPASHHSELPQALRHLRQLQATLTEMQGQLQQIIRAVELTMKGQI